MRIINTVKHMTLRQWKYRLYYTTRNKIKKRKPILPQIEINPLTLPTYYKTNINKIESIDIADGILNNHIPAITGLTIDFTGDWDIKNEDYRLICFKLNSFHFLLDLSDAYRITGQKKYIYKGFELICDWWNKNGDLISGDKWNAYVLADRIENWIGFCSEYAEENIGRYTDWIYAQAYELKASMEYHLGANHLLSEAKALIYAGSFLNNDSLYNLGKKVLLNEAKEQFLRDGGHYERSPSYHVESLQQLFESYVVMKDKGDPDIKTLVELMKEPYEFLNGIIGVDGRVPLFNDAAYDYPFYDARDFLSTAKYIYSISPKKGREGDYCKRWNWLCAGTDKINWKEKTLYKDTGFVHYQFEKKDARYSVFMDCGNNGPDYNLGHTHADALSVLISSEYKPILVDSGVFTYKPGIKRNECRATKAHNTVEIEGENSAEIWSAFRVARRGHVAIHSYSESNGLFVKASHDGYTKCLGEKADHIRSVTVDPLSGSINISDLIIEDNIHRCVSRYHIGSECAIDMISDTTCSIDSDIIISSADPIKIVDCKIAGCFGKLETSKCIEIEFNKTTNTVIEIKGVC